MCTHVIVYKYLVLTVVAVVSWTHVRRVRPQPQLSPCHPPPRIRPPRFESPQTHPLQSLLLARCSSRPLASRLEGGGSDRPRAGLSDPPLSASWACRRCPRYPAPSRPVRSALPHSLPRARSYLRSHYRPHPRPALQTGHCPRLG